MKKKHITAMTLTCLMMISALATTGLMTVNAGNPNAGGLTMHMVLHAVDEDGEHAIALSLQEELAKIGITLELDYRDYEYYTSTIGDHGTHWNITWDDAPNLGWDMKFWEFWGMPTSLLWWPGMMSAAGAPPDGWQTMSYNNTKADALLRQQFEEFDPVERKKLMLLYQQEFVHDGYGPGLYSPELIQCVDRRFQTPWGTPGWEDAVWWYDPFLYTWVEDPMPEHVTLKFADPSVWYVYNPIYMWTRVQDMTQCKTHSMLYVVTKEYGAAVGEGYTVRPYLASGDPVWADDHLTCNISLRDDVYWHNFTDIYTDPLNPIEYNNEKFTADDVVMTFAALMDPDVGAWGNGDFIGVLDTIVYPGGCEKLDDFTVRFHLERPYVELKDLLADEWAAFILPEHILGSVAPGDWYGHWTNGVRPPPGTGPYRWIEQNEEENWWRLEKVPNYPTGLNPFGYGEVVPDEIIGYTIFDQTAGWTALMNHEIHLGSGSWDATLSQLEAANATGEFWVFNSPMPAVRQLSFNLNHPVLSNRYVRQAIAHAINYPKIRDDILPLAGLNGFLQATPVWRSLTQFYPTPAEEVLYNIGPYEYNIAVAQQYMDMWKYSLSANAPEGSPEVALGPVGDADFSGIADLDDFVVWAENVGTSPIDWPWWPCKDIDPDADNTDYVEMADFYDWRENIGKHYPFDGAR